MRRAAPSVDPGQPGDDTGRSALIPSSRPLRLVGVEPPGPGRARSYLAGSRGGRRRPNRRPVRGLVPHRHPIAPGAQHAVERAAGDVQLLARVRALTIVSISASTAGSAIPAMLREPGVRRLAIRRPCRRPSPGVGASRRAPRLVMSKSKSSMRRWYCAASTMRERRLNAETRQIPDERLRVRLQRCLEVEELDRRTARRSAA